jgi:fibronectin-binding autotransporter adhesin
MVKRIGTSGRLASYCVIRHRVAFRFGPAALARHSCFRAAGFHAAALLTVFALFAAPLARASEWTGGNATWGTVGNPGWDVVPDGQGAIASKMDTVTAITTLNDLFGVVVGTLTLGGSSNISWTHTLTNGITFDQDGVGVGSPATISNTDTNTGATNGLIVGALLNPITLADDLLVTNTGGSTRSTGAIAILGSINGSANVTLSSDAAIGSPTASVFPGAIRLQNGANANTFFGSVFIPKGLVAYNGTSFGDTSNSITLGAAGSDSAMMISTATTGLVPQNVTVAAGNTGTLTLGAAVDSTFTPYSGTITLNSSLSLRAGTTTTGVNVTQTYPGAISGTGGLTKTGTAIAALTAANNYAGTTTVSAGTLLFNGTQSLYNGVSGSWTAANLVVQSGATMGFSIGDFGDFVDADIAAFNALGSGSDGFMDGSNLGLNPTVASYTYPNPIVNSNGGANAVGLTKLGANALITNATNTYTGKTTVLGGTLQFGKEASLYNNTPASWTSANITALSGTALTFNVGGTDEFTASDIATLSGLGTATGGFRSGSTLGLDTTNASGGEFVYNNAIANTNANANILGLRKEGANTLTLGGANTYTGVTTVNAGTLKITGSHTGGSDYNVARTVGSTAEVVLDGGAAGSMSFARYAYIGTSGGNGTFTQMDGNVTIGVAGMEASAYGELFVGYQQGVSGAVGHYDLRAGTLTVNGYSDLGRDGATAVFDNAGTYNCTREVRVGVGYTGIGGTGTFNNLGGVVNIGAPGISSYLKIGYGSGSSGTFIQTGAGSSVSVGTPTSPHGSTELYLGGTPNPGGVGATGYYDLQAGSLTVYGYSNLGRDGGSAVFDNRGTFTTAEELRIGVDYTGLGGTATVNNLDGGVIVATIILLGREGSLSSGTLNMNAPTGSISVTGSAGRIYIGTRGTGDFEMVAGTVSLPDAAADLLIGYYPGSIGLLHQTGGSIIAGDVPVGGIPVGDQTYVGVSGSGTYNMDGGLYKVGDNLYIGLNAGSDGTVNQTNGTITLVGNEPSYTGNVLVGDNGTGMYTISGGLLDLVVPGDTGTNNSASYSITNNVGGAGHELDLAQDGNVRIGAGANTGELVQSGGTINAAANVYVANAATATGTMTMTGGATHVGTTSPTGGDVLIAYLPGSTGTVNLQGGLLDVAHGSGMIGAGLGAAAFNFTGGTLKVKDFNNTTVFGGDLSGLAQDGATSLLDVTGNDTLIHGFYNQTAGKAAVGASQTLSVEGNTRLFGTFAVDVSGAAIGKVAVSGGLTLGDASVLDVQGALNGAISYVIATYDAGTLMGTFFNATAATSHGYNVVYDNAGGQIILDELDGDANHDGVVNIFDVNLVSANWDPTGPVGAFAPGNINHDTTVNIFDINLISANWNNVATNGGVAHAQPVPEPATLGLAAVALAGLALAGRLGTVRRKKS